MRIHHEPSVSTLYDFSMTDVCSVPVGAQIFKFLLEILARKSDVYLHYHVLQGFASTPTIRKAVQVANSACNKSKLWDTSWTVENDPDRVFDPWRRASCEFLYKEEWKDNTHVQSCLNTLSPGIETSPAPLSSSVRTSSPQRVTGSSAKQNGSNGLGPVLPETGD